MDLLASGRDSLVYACGDGSVLRRYRDSRSAEGEAATIRAVAALGYPVPTVHEARGPDIVMERIDGPTLAETLFTGSVPEDVGRVLGRLHDRLHALAWPDADEGESLLHLDLHPLNVIMRDGSPVVIDWSNARPGPAALDVALSALILAQVVVAEEVPAAAGLDVPASFGGARVPALVDGVLRGFLTDVSTPWTDHLAEARELRSRDPGQTADELAMLDTAVEHVRSLG